MRGLALTRAIVYYSSTTRTFSPIIDGKDKPQTENSDQYVSAELSDPDSRAFSIESVSTMVRGPCGSAYQKDGETPSTTRKIVKRGSLPRLMTFGVVLATLAVLLTRAAAGTMHHGGHESKGKARL